MGHLKSFFSLSHKIRFAKLWDKKNINKDENICLSTGNANGYYLNSTRGCYDQKGFTLLMSYGPGTAWPI
jgi:hypothetical protein